MKFKSLYMTIGVAMLFAGCSQDQGVNHDSEDIYLGFTLSVADTGSGTRAEGDPFNGQDWGTDYTPSEVGTVFENTVKEVVPVLYPVDEATGKLMTSVIAGEITSPALVKEEKDGLINYSITGKLKTSFHPDVLKSGSYRLVVFVNPKSAVNNKNPETCDFQLAGAPSGNFDRIPMWGVADVDLSNLEAGKTVFIKDKTGKDLNMPVLRSMAKIRIKLDHTDPDMVGRDVKLTKVTVHNLNDKGYIVPNSWSSLSSITSLGIPSTINALTSWKQGDFVAAGTSDIATESEINFYLPEVVNTTGEREVVIRVNYKCDGLEEEKTGDIHLCLYGTDGKPVANAKLWNVVRNHIYEYTITGVAKNYSLNAQVCVKKWLYHRIPTEL